MVRAAGKAAVNVACIGMRVVVKIDQVEVGGIAELFTAQFAVADDGELRRITVFFGHICPRARHGGGENGVGKSGELVGK